MHFCLVANSGGATVKGGSARGSAHALSVGGDVWMPLTGARAAPLALNETGLLVCQEVGEMCPEGPKRFRLL